MAKQQILLVDADSSSARLLEVSLRSAGFTVATADSAESALGKLEHGTPDLILTDTRLPGADGFAFVRKLRAKPELSEVPVVFLSEQGALDDKLRGLELGVDDYLSKPIFVREVVTRVQLLLARKKQQRIAVEPLARTRFSGSLEDVAVVDLLQTIAVSGKSGVASVTRGERQAWLYFDRGQVIDAEVGDLRGEEAVYRVITWSNGAFDLEFKAIERARVIDAPHQALLMEGLRRVDELGRLAEQLPPEQAVIDIDHDALAGRLNEIPDELNGILRLIDGKRTLLDLIDASPFDDLSTLTVLSKFYFEGLLSAGTPEPVEWAPGSGPNARLPSTPPAGVPEGIELTGSELTGSATPVAAEPLAAVQPAASHPAAVYHEPFVATLVPPGRPPPTVPPSTVPAAVEPPREARRFTPAPATARAATPTAATDTKLTPKGIVNIGGDAPPPSKPAPAPAPTPAPAPAAPVRSAADTPKRSPIPMPLQHARGNGAYTNGVHGNGLRETRTAMGLSANPLHDPARDAARDAKAQTPAAPTVAKRAVEQRQQPGSEKDKDTPIAAPAGVSRSAVTAPPTRGAARAAETPGSNAEPEHEFFEAGDHGTYAGGPRSVAPEALAVPEVDEPLPVRRAVTPSRHARARRGKLVVVGLLALASAALAFGAWRQSREAEPDPRAFPAQGTVAATQPAAAPSAEPSAPHAAAAPANEPAALTEPGAADPGAADPGAAPPGSVEAAPTTAADAPVAAPTDGTPAGAAAAPGAPTPAIETRVARPPTSAAVVPEAALPAAAPERNATAAPATAAPATPAPAAPARAKPPRPSAPAPRASAPRNRPAAASPVAPKTKIPTFDAPPAPPLPGQAPTPPAASPPAASPPAASPPAASPPAANPPAAGSPAPKKEKPPTASFPAP